MELAKINAHYQVTIPKAVRQKAKVKKGSYVKVEYQDGAIFIRPVTVLEEKEELSTLRQAAEKKFAEVWKDEDDAVWKATYRQRDILLTRFPFSDLIGSKVRPVLVLSNDAYNRRFSDVLICAITSNPRPHEYATDLGAKDLEEGVLKVESKTRSDTITSIEQEIVLKKIGRVKKEKYRQVVNLVQKLIDAR